MASSTARWLVGAGVVVGLGAYALMTLSHPKAAAPPRQSTSTPTTAAPAPENPAATPSSSGGDGVVMSMDHTDAGFKAVNGTCPSPSDSKAPPAPTQPSASGKSLAVDAARSCASYTISETFADVKTLSKAVALTNAIAGAFHLTDAGQLAPSTVRVDVNTLHSGAKSRDNKIPVLLKTDRYPYAEFQIATVEQGQPLTADGKDVTVKLTGKLSIAGVERSQAFQGTAVYRDGALQVDASGELKLSDFDIKPPTLLGFVKVEDLVRVDVHIVAAAQ